MRVLILSLLSLCLSTILAGQGTFEVTPDIKKAYDAVSSLRFDDARLTIDQIKTNDPNNVLVYHIENYIDFYTIFINENEDEFKRLKKNKDHRLEMIRKGDKNSPYYRFAQAEVLLQWIVAESKFITTKWGGLSIAKDANTAYRLLEKNEEEFPSFIENKKSLSVIHALANYLSSFVKKILKIRGSLPLGKQEIEEVVAKSNETDLLFREEAYAINAYMLVHLFNQPEEAWQVLNAGQLDHTKNPLASFLYATVALKSGRSGDALRILEETPRGDGYFPFYYLDYLHGKCLLFDLDPRAKEYIQLYIDNFKGRHFIKDAYQKLGWYELAINNDLPAYKYAMSSCQKYGEDYLEDDQQALREAKQKKVPNVELLKARLLYDGGYYNKALSHLIQKSWMFTPGTAHELEYNYRMGRISHALKSYHDAIEYYKLAINEGKDQSSFFACNAALQIGLIYEDQSYDKEAVYYFEICKELDADSYEGQLHKKAEAGKERIKKK